MRTRNPQAAALSPADAELTRRGIATAERVEIEGEFRQSNNYDGTSVATGDATQGWRSEGNGDVEWGNARVRGEVIIGPSGEQHLEMKVEAGIAQLLFFSGDPDEIDPGHLYSNAAFGSADVDLQTPVIGPSGVSASTFLSSSLGDGTGGFAKLESGGSSLLVQNADTSTFTFDGDWNVVGTGAATFDVAGDVEIVGDGKGLVLASPDGTRWRIVIDNAGAVSVATA